ncbi:MAG: hypothetical protein AAFY73_02625 [Pseudomonadota bacterium]
MAALRKRHRSSETNVSNTSELETLRNLLLADDRVSAGLWADEIDERLSQALTRDDFYKTLTEALASALKDAEREDPRAIAKAI